VRHGTEFQFKRIVDTFTGDDGGVSFVATRFLVEELDNRAANGDTVADDVLNATIGRMFRFIMLAERTLSDHHTQQGELT
jgi:hypothetical protein